MAGTNVSESDKAADRSTASDEYTPEEAERRSEATLKRLLATPPKPHDDGKAKRPVDRK